MPYYPIFLDLSDEPCLVVGGGEVAARKAASLLEAGARVRLVAPRLGPEIEAMQRAAKLDVERRRFRASDLDDCILVIAATDDAEVNRSVHAGARRRRIPCNVVDQPDLCTFIVPALLRRGDLVVAVSTGGASPAVSRRLRRELAAQLGPEYAAFLGILREARRRLKDEVAERTERRRALYRLVSSRALDLLRAGRADEARALAESIVEEAIRLATPGRQALNPERT